MNAMQLTIHQGCDGRWCGRVVAGNGQIVLVTEAYTRKVDARRGLAAAVSGICRRYRNIAEGLMNVEIETVDGPATAGRPEAEAAKQT